MDPDWVYDTSLQEFRLTKGCLQRPRIEVEVCETGWAPWELFKPHHYLLDAGPMAFSTAYTGFVADEPVCFLGMSGKVAGRRREARACRMVVMPEWQGAGIGMRFLNAMCQRELDGDGFIGNPTTTLFHTAHPALVGALKRDPKWHQVSAALHGANRRQGILNMRKSSSKKVMGGFGGHFRGVTGWRYYG
jgi:GNAT superfamily N-acetyltransferase